jgi:AcrR family transcriptional regulator
MTRVFPPSPPRSYGGRPAAARRLERRERWLAAGLELFGTVGFRGTSLRALARESGVAERYFAENFAGLDDLFVAVHQRLHDELQEAVSRAVRDAGPGISERVRAGLQALVDGFAGDPRCGRIKLTENVLAGPKALTALQSSRRELATLLICGLEGTRLPEGIDPEVLGLAMAGGVFELIMAWYTGRLKLAREDLVEHCALLVLAVYRGVGGLGSLQNVTGP